MKRRISITLIALALLLASCELPGTPIPVTTPTADPTAALTETAGPSLTPTATITPTLSPTPTNTPTATPTPTETPRPTPTKIFVPGENLLINPGFEGQYAMVRYWSELEGMYIEHFMAPGWDAFYCNIPYTPENCPALRRCDPAVDFPCSAGIAPTGYNPPDLMMGRPEYRPINMVQPYSGENAQQFFLFDRCGEMGVYQTFPTTPGETYVVGAMIREWWNKDGDAQSDVETEDDAAGSVWRIFVDTSGGTFAFADEVIASPPLDIPEDAWVDYGIYEGERYQYTLEFVANSYNATVFFHNLRLWPIGNNDSYIDDAFAFHKESEGEEEEIAPIEDWDIEAQSLPAREAPSTEGATRIPGQVTAMLAALLGFAFALIVHVAKDNIQGVYKMETFEKLLQLPLIGPLLSLLRSRKFWVAAGTLAAEMAAAQVPELAPVQAEMAAVIALIGVSVIAGIAYEDGKQKSGMG